MTTGVVLIEPHMLKQSLLDRLIEEFASRDGTDYGVVEVSLTAKCQQLRSMLARGEVKIAFDIASETPNLVTAYDARHLVHGTLTTATERVSNAQ